MIRIIMYTRNCHIEEETLLSYDVELLIMYISLPSLLIAICFVFVVHIRFVLI